MTRQRWIQHPETFELIPADEYVSPREHNAPFVMGELQPYKSMVTGEMIEGRRQHREHLRQHGVIEVGNERLTPKPVSQPSREDIRRDLYQIANAKGY